MRPGNSLLHIEERLVKGACGGGLRGQSWSWFSSRCINRRVVGRNAGNPYHVPCFHPADQWLAKSSAEAQSCTEAAKRWSERMQRFRAVLPVEIYGQLAGAGTGRFNALLSDNGLANAVFTSLT